MSEHNERQATRGIVRSRAVLRTGLFCLSLAFGGGIASLDVRAEVKEIFLGQQFGAVFIPAMVMESQKLIEKQLAADGLGDVKVNWTKLGGPAALNDAMLAGGIHFACQGAPSMAVIWDRTRTGIQVKALGAVANNNIWLNTRNPNISSLKDFTEKDRIAVPSLKVSTQAMLMHYAATQIWGKGQHTHLDHIIVALPHPEAYAALSRPGHEINSHFATSPFHELEMKVGGIKTITSAYEIMGGPTTGLTFTSTETFRAANPKIFAAVNKAFDEGFAWTNADKRRTAKLFIELTKEKILTEDDLVTMMNSPDLQFTKVPSNVGKMVDFMHSIGSVKTKAASWKDLFFPEAHNLPGT